MEDPRLTFLINAWLDGSLTSSDKAELEELLLSSASARRQFWDQASLHGLLYESAKLQWLEQTASRSFSRHATPTGSLLGRLFQSFSPTRTCWAAAIVCALFVLALAALSGRWGHSRNSRDSSSSEFFPGELTSSGVAVLTHCVGVRWSDSKPPPEIGTVLEPGWLRFESGLIQIEFYSGARALVEGPAELQLISRSEAFCRRGKLSAEVPPQARGFRVGSPRMTVIDLGTEFGLNVGGDKAEVHVFQGEVNFTRPDDPANTQTLKEGDAVAVDTAGKLQEFSANRSSFVPVAKMEQVSSEALRRRYETWRLASRELKTDPALVVHFDFEDLTSGNRALRNRAIQESPADGALVGCEWTEGRWPGKGALEFKRISDRVRVYVNGDFESVTLMAWLRVDSIEHKFNSLMLSDGFELGGLHWQITKEGRIRLGLGNGDPMRTSRFVPSAGDFDSPVIFTPERIGQWVHLAVTYDGPSRTVTHYVDSDPVSIESKKDPLPNRIHIRAADLGNWNNSSGVISTCPIRNFRGRIDEFAFFSRVLSPAEIKKIHSYGSIQPEAVRLFANKPEPK